MAFQVSPGVQVKEVDLTNVVPAVSSTVGAFAGSFRWGPVDEVVSVSDSKGLVDAFYTPADTDAGAEDFYSAEAFLRYGSSLKVVRVASSTAYNANNGVHPDHHAWWIHPEDGSFMIDGNDGGLNITHDGGNSWRFIGNIPVGQFYHISVDNEYPYNVYGGMQDNGSWRGPAYVWKAQGIRNSYWQEIAFGDGFDVVPDKDDSRFGYAMSCLLYTYPSPRD